MEQPMLGHPRNEIVAEVVISLQDGSVCKVQMMFNGSFLNAGCNFFVVVSGKVVCPKGQTGWNDNRGAKDTLIRCTNYLIYDLVN
jgi:hypothetical protein